MIRCLIMILLLSLLTIYSLFGQEQKSILQQANDAYAREEYAVAATLYIRIANSKKNKMPVELLMKLASCYQQTGYFLESFRIYQEIVTRTAPPAAAYFAYGEALRQMEQYDAAKQQYLLFSTFNNDSLKLKEVGMQSCDSALAWKKQRVSLELSPVKVLNTPESDLISGVMNKGLLLLANGYRTMGLNGGAEAHPRKDKRTNEPFYKAYVYGEYATGNATTYLEELEPALLGSFGYHIGSVCFNRTEDTLYATVNIQDKSIPINVKGPVNRVRGLLIYQAVKTNGNWGQLRSLPGINVAGYSSCHPMLSTTGNILYFISDRPGGCGQTDLWYSEKQADGNWGVPFNCGEKINTVASEAFPTINEEGFLYFSSKGYVGLGGYDIYRAKGEKDSWEIPEDLKSPFNSGGDDIGLILKRNGYEGYLSSNRLGGMGRDDIYYFMDPTYFSRLNHKTTSIVPDSGISQHSLIELPIAQKTHTAEEEYDKKLLEKLRFFYDYNSIILSTESRVALDLVAGVLKRHADWRLVIVSYSDCRGSDPFNSGLSALRCFTVIDYLESKGIDSHRLFYSNKGELEPVNGCKDGVPCSEDEYRLNRRSELKVKW